MNPLIETASAGEQFQKAINDIRTTALERIKLCDDVGTQVVELGTQLSTTASLYCYGKTIHITVDNREDLQKCLALGSLWKKSNNGGGIQYVWTNLLGYSFTIQAKENALPATCKVVKEQVLIPARPAYYETVEKVSCNLRPGISTAQEEVRSS